MKMRCTGAVYVVGRGIVTENEVVDLDEESLKDARVSAHFVPNCKRARRGSGNGGAGASAQNLPGLEPAGEGGAE